MTSFTEQELEAKLSLGYSRPYCITADYLVLSDFAE